MIQLLMHQGINCIIATPHFYAVNDHIDRFLERRNSAFENLRRKLPHESPAILLGAEVAFFNGISRSDCLERLTIEGTDTLLLEMPFSPWGESELDEIEYILNHTKLNLVLAHLERYTLIPENKKKIERLIELPLTVQVNAGSLLEWRRRGKSIRILKNAQTCLLGSDCHGVHHRPPNLQAGREVVEKKLGRQFLEQIDETGAQLIKQVKRSESQ
jgi:protein-tyrosine phosphatase